MLQHDFQSDFAVIKDYALAGMGKPPQNDRISVSWIYKKDMGFFNYKRFLPT